jgi:hypothetical protein
VSQVKRKLDEQVLNHNLLKAEFNHFKNNDKDGSDPDTAVIARQLELSTDRFNQKFS